MTKTGTHPPNNAAVLYCRVSTQGQANDGLSLEMQRERLHAYATLRGLDVVECVIEPAVSGSVPLTDRPNGRRVAELVSDGIVGHVVAWKLDRLFRDAADALVTTREWDRAGVALHLADMGGSSIDTSGAMGRMFLTMMAGFAEMERSLITERCAAGRRRKAEKGGYIGGEAPFGWTLTETGTLEANPSEQRVIGAAADLQGSGMSLRAIGAALSRRGLLPRGGSKWHPQTVKRVLSARQAA